MKRKSVVIAVLTATFVFILLPLSFKWGAGYVVEDALHNKLPPHLKIHYTSLQINVWGPGLTIVNPAITLFSKDMTAELLSVKADTFLLKKIGVLDLWLKEKIDIGTLALIRPVIVHHKHTNVKNEDREIEGKQHAFSIETIRIKDGTFQQLDSVGQTLYTQHMEVELEDISNAADYSKNVFPFVYGALKLSLKNTTVNLGEYEDLQIDELIADQHTLTATGTCLKNHYNKEEFSKVIPYEKDYIKLDIPKIEVNGFTLGKKNDSLSVTAQHLAIWNFDLNVYRDKNPVDDLRYKPLYGKQLQKLPFIIGLPLIALTNGKVVYQEKAENTDEAGSLLFDNITGTVSNFSNIRSDQDTIRVSLESNLMNSGKLNLDWKFPVFDPQQQFLAVGNVTHLNTSSLNEFLTPNLNVVANGTIKELYFTISGNNNASNGEVKIRYNDFQFKVLKKNGAGVNKVLTLVGNLLVHKGSKPEEDNYREGIIAVERNQNKSFFNYLWISLESGLTDAIKSL